MTQAAAAPLSGQDRKTLVEGVVEAARAGDLDLARRLALSALARGLEHPLLLNLRALDHEEAGRFDRALTDLRRAHVLAPRDYGILNACGLCLGRMERPEEAAQCFEQAIALQPAFGPAWFNRGWSLERLGRTGEAARCYERAVEINPENAQAWANMALLAIKRGEAAMARDHAETALRLEAAHPTAQLALAELELREPARAETRLRGLLAGTLGAFDRALANGLLADSLDAQGRAAEAFAAYETSNEIFREQSAARFEAPGQSTIPDTIGWLLRWAERLDPAVWRSKPATAATTRAGEARHVFLLGFPRSGTTLAETVLLNHPDVISLEERDTFHASVLDFLTDPRGLDRLASTAERDLRFYRDDYWTRVKEFGVDPAGKIFIDKNPFNALKLPLIYKLFPDARVIFAVRDPRDVVLSCFRRRFILNASTYELLDLRRAANYYDGSMRLAEILRSKQTLAEYQLVYERLVEDLPGVARAACDFIGAAWRDDLLDISARARRGEVASASSAQIARGLFSDGAGQWRRYRAEMASVAPILAPWVAKFGYPVE
jgi:tetratricopeptide (TPR) repeat protein